MLLDLHSQHSQQVLRILTVIVFVCIQLRGFHAIVAAAAATDTACAAVIDTLRYAYLRTASAAFHFRACALPLPHAACLLLPFVRVVAQFYYLCAAIKYLSLRARQVYRQAVAAVRIQRCIKRVAFLQFAPLLQLTRL